MESNITSDHIYTLFLKLKNDGLNDAEIKRALFNGVMGEYDFIQSLNKETIFLNKHRKARFNKKSIAYSVLRAASIYLVVLPFLPENAANFFFDNGTLCVNLFGY